MIDFMHRTRRNSAPPAEFRAESDCEYSIDAQSIDNSSQMELLIRATLRYLFPGECVPSFWQIEQPESRRYDCGCTITQRIKKTQLTLCFGNRRRRAKKTWPSQFGPGRPGWHIECSAMSMDALGETFDIHGGGPDLKFYIMKMRLHNRGTTGCTFARYWIHAGAVRVNEEKMSKSLGNLSR